MQQSDKLYSQIHGSESEQNALHTECNNDRPIDKLYIDYLCQFILQESEWKNEVAVSSS